ncbi:MAG: hypothetical protein QM820_35695 [Minicystis sp.]
MRRLLLTIVLAAGCQLDPARGPEEESGLPLVVPEAPPPAADPVRVPPTPALDAPLSAAACEALQIYLPQTKSIIPHEAYERAFAGAAPALREAVCACPPSAEEVWLVVRTTPDRGDLSARTREGSAKIDACLAYQLRGAALPRWHLGGDCIGCGPKRYGVFRGSAPADAEPPDGTATLSFPVLVRR